MTSRTHILNRRLQGAASSLAALFLLLASLLPFVGRVAAQSSPTSTPANPYGVNVFLHKEVEPWKIEQTLRMISEANIPWIKQEFPWQEIEFKKGYFFDDKWQKSSWEKFDRIVDLADKYHLKIIARVDHAPVWAQAAAGGTQPLKDNKDLADFTNALLDHYKGRIQYVQVWNEPNLTGEWVPGKAVQPAQYAAMLKEVYPIVKAAHSDSVVMSAPMAMTLEGPESRGNMNEIDYWTGLYATGIKGNFDIASANGYGLDQAPDAAPDPKVLNFRRVELIRDVMVRNGDTDRPIWFDEYAWNDSPETLAKEERDFWRHVTPQQQAAWTVQGIDYARKNWPWAGVISIWYFRQVGDIPPEKAEYYFGMVNPDFTTQPVYQSVKTDASKFPGPASQVAGTPVNPPPSPTPGAGNPTAPAKPTALRPSPTASRQQPTRQASPGTTRQPVVVTPTQSASSATGGATPTTNTTPITETTLIPALPPTAATAVATIPPTKSPATPTSGLGIGPAPPTATIVPGTLAGTSSGTNTLLYVVGGVLVLAGLAALGYYFARSRPKTGE